METFFIPDVSARQFYRPFYILLILNRKKETFVVYFVSGCFFPCCFGAAVSASVRLFPPAIRYKLAESPAIADFYKA